MHSNRITIMLVVKKIKPPCSLMQKKLQESKINIRAPRNGKGEAFHLKNGTV